jgi:CBS domain-containing protein
MRIGEICERKVVHCTRNASIGEIARLMREHHVGDVIVVDVQGTNLIPIGIVTDRDLVVEVLAPDVARGDLCAEDLIKGELVTATEEELVYDAIWYMRSRGVRRLPVVDQRGCLVGILTADDVSRYLAVQLSELAQVPSHQKTLETTRLAPLAV